MVLKVLAIIIALVVVFTIGYMIVNSVIGLFNGQSIGDAIHASWYNITHLFGLIKDKVNADIVYPMANQYITWTYANASAPQ